MYHPETEDMLPRMAPKPSSAIPMGSSEANVRPQVPEISILFGQQDGNVQQQNAYMQQNQNKNNTQQSYASWKKQMLPKVTYPAIAAMLQTNNGQPEILNNKNNPIEDYNIPRSTLYPLRATNTMPGSTQSNGGFTKMNSGLAVNSPLTYHRSLENCNNNNNMAYQTIQQQQQQYQQPSSRQIMPLTQPSPRDILTICAGTQTETISGSYNNAQGVPDINWSNLASKKDLDDILQLVKDMRNEQLRIVHMLETLLFAPQVARKPDTSDMSVQVDINGNEDLPKLNELQDKVQPSSVPTNKFIQHLKPSTNILQTPKGKPMAQSTTYRPNSPQSQPFPEPVPVNSNYQKPPNAPTALTKSSSDTSLAMNELALKYLPNEKLAELLNELNMVAPMPAATTQNRFKAVAQQNPATPDKGNLENFERSSTDISNASYKYLKKYRLLPEDHQDQANDCENINENHQTPQYFTPQRQQQQQYDHIKHATPIRQTPPGKCSPYSGGRLPLSPLARAASPATPQHLVDLENIKYQPKFL